MNLTGVVETVDVAVMIAYALGLILYCVKDRHRSVQARDLFLASGTASWVRVGFSAFAGTISVTGLIAITGSAYAYGISVFNYDWMATVVLAIFCATILPLYLKSKIYTVPEFLELRFGRFERQYVAGMTLLLSLIVDGPCALFAGSVLLQTLLPNLSLWPVCIGLAGAAGLFVIFGGLRGVMLIEAIQGAVLLLICAGIAIAVASAFGGVQPMMQAIPETHRHLVMPATDATMPWLGLITGVPLIGFYFWCANQGMVQRILAARSLDHGRWGSLLAGGLKLTTLFLILIPAAAAATLFPNLRTADTLFPHLVFETLPHGIVGLALIACLISIISSLSATYNSASTIITMDYARKYVPNLSDRSLVAVGRGAMFVVMASSIAFVPVIASLPQTLFQYLQGALCFVVPPAAAVFIAGILLKSVNAYGARWALGVGSALSIFLFVTVEIMHLYSLHFLIVAPAIFIVSLLAIIGFSPFASKAPPTTTMVWSGALWVAESEALSNVPWFKNYRILAVGLLIIAGLIVVAFH